MAIYLLVVLLSVGLSLFDFKRETGGLKYAFILITVFLGVRYMYGSDYPAYLELFRQYNSDGIPIWDIKGMLNSDVYGEIGWQILNKLFGPFGYFGLIFSLSVFENIVIYKLIERNVPAQWYWLAIIVYLLNTRFFLIGACSMERQWLAICVFIIAVKYIEQRRLIPYVLLVLLAASFHRSALILLPFYAIGFIKNLRIRIGHILLIILGLYIWNYFAPLVLEPLFAGSLFDEGDVFSEYLRYAGRDSNTGQYSTIGLITDVFLTYLFPFLGLLYCSRLNSKNQKYFLLFAFALFFKPIAEVIPMINRMDYFFIVYSIALIPLLLSVIPKKYHLLTLFATLFLVAIYARQTMVFLTDSNWARSYVYKTIFSVPWI